MSYTTQARHRQPPPYQPHPFRSRRKPGRGRGNPPSGQRKTTNYPTSTHEHQTTITNSRRKRADSRRWETLARSRNQFPAPFSGGNRARRCGDGRRPARPPHGRNGGSGHRPPRTSTRPGGRVPRALSAVPAGAARVRPLDARCGLSLVLVRCSWAHVRAVVFVFVLSWARVVGSAGSCGRALWCGVGLCCRGGRRSPMPLWG